MDASKSTKLMADILQVCHRAWLPLFYSVVPFIMHAIHHEDKFNPLVALTFDELRTNYGDELGEVIEHQFGLLWQVVARGNPNSLSSMTLGSAAESLFSEIKMLKNPNGFEIF
jgi:hypothetical protein